MKRLVVLLAVVLAGCTGAPAPTPAEDEPPAHHEDRFNLVPPGSREINFEMDARDVVRVVFNATYDVTWDLHSHDGRNVTTWQEGRGMEAAIDFTAAQTNTYSVWIKTTGPITTTVHYRMDGQFTLAE